MSQELKLLPCPACGTDDEDIWDISEDSGCTHFFAAAAACVAQRAQIRQLA